MISSRLHSWHDNWRAPPPQPPPMMQPPLNTRPMLACADGSFLPLIAKYHHSPHAHVFELDASLCPDVQLAIKKAQHSPPVYHALPSTPMYSESPTKAETAHHGPEYPGGRVGPEPNDEYQERINAIVADNRQRATAMPQQLPGMPITSAHHRATLSSSSTTNDGKEYCTYWIRRGECDYVQQGCRYKHEMPPLDKLKEIGFKEYPKWWQEKLQYSRPNVTVRAKHDTGALKRMIDAHLGRKAGGDGNPGSVDGSESANGTNAEPVVVPTVRQRIVVTPERVAASASKTAEVATVAPVTPPTTPTRQQAQPDDLLDLISDSESDTLQPALAAPHDTSEHTSPYRQGRFVPYNEKPTASEAPSRIELRSPSPLLLETQHEPVHLVPPNTPTLSAESASPLFAQRIPPAATPVGYQGKVNGISKTTDIHETPPQNGSNRQLQRIEELEAKFSALQQKTTPTGKGKGLYKSKYADPTKSSSTNAIGDARIKGRHRSRPSPPPVARKNVSAKAVAGLQECREQSEKVKEHIVETKTELKKVDIVIQPRPQPVKVYRHLFEEEA